ncbi:PDZ-binding protein, CRIPT, partial [Dillenia turbinata]
AKSSFQSYNMEGYFSPFVFLFLWSPKLGQFLASTRLFPTDITQTLRETTRVSERRQKSVEKESGEEEWCARSVSSSFSFYQFRERERGGEREFYRNWKGLKEIEFLNFAGEKKLAKVIVPDKWKEGASNTNESGGRKINENKLLSKKNRSLSRSLDGHHMEAQSVLSASNRFTRMPSIVTLAPTAKECVQCAASRYLTPSFTNRAMYNAESDYILSACSKLSLY